jgi:hypothetical protein
MAIQNCPKCKTESFVWSCEDDEPLTQWYCFNCKYIAHEDESLVCICEKCNKKTKSRLEETTGEYWWCSNCNFIS